ncbi:Uncharacterised protein [Neisseria zoodegmatis]|uniref:Nickel transporter n=2 Tax=Neisseria TaxID=482 RepID=A0A378WTD9_9NEIS|nr:hypothetical protein [Neisseria zoodegmatis]SUA44580.1 Uncharacterised protein [Neisseria zoodegmatis]
MNSLYEVISQSIDSVLENYDLTENTQTNKAITQQIKQVINLKVAPQIELIELKNKLDILFEYEKNYLTLLKDFKEEIKFANALQEDLRKERAKFFSEILREVSSTLSQAQVEESVASSWIQDLVKSYTNSLNLSSNLVDENILNTIGKIRANAKSNTVDISLNNQNE